MHTNTYKFLKAYTRYYKYETLVFFGANSYQFSTNTDQNKVSETFCIQWHSTSLMVFVVHSKETGVVMLVTPLTFYATDAQVSKLDALEHGFHCIEIRHMVRHVLTLNSVSYTALFRNKKYLINYITIWISTV